MGRKPRSQDGPAYATVAVRLTPDERERLDALQALWGLGTASETLRRMLLETFEDLEGGKMRHGGDR